MPRNPDAMNSLLKYIDLVVNSCDEVAVSAYKEQIDIEAKKFYTSISKSGSRSLDDELLPFEQCKVDYTNRTTNKLYGYKFDWSNETVTRESKTTWHDLAWMFNSGKTAFKGGTGFISRAAHRLKGLDKRAFSRYKAQLRKKVGG